MAGNGFYDPVDRVYRPKSSETWTSYSTWDSWTDWDGTPDVSSPLEFTTKVFDAGDINFTAVLVEYEAANPVTTQISYGNTLSSGSIVSPTTTTIYPNDSNVPLLEGRYFQITAYQDQDSPSLSFPLFQSIDVEVKTQSMESVLAEADYVTLHVPAQKEYVIGEAQFDQMKDGSVIVNAARGGVIDEVALLKALDSGKLAFAGLDTFEDEPKPAIQVLMHPKVSLTPHIGAATGEAQDRIGVELAEQISAILA